MHAWRGQHATGEFLTRQASKTHAKHSSEKSEPSTVESGAVKLGADKLGADKPGADKSGADKSGAVEPTVGQMQDVNELEPRLVWSELSRRWRARLSSLLL